jgi:hypothetical protein
MTTTELRHAVLIEVLTVLDSSRAPRLLANAIGDTNLTLLGCDQIAPTILLIVALDEEAAIPTWQAHFVEQLFRNLQP